MGDRLAEQNVWPFGTLTSLIARVVNMMVLKINNTQIILYLLP